MSGMGRVGGYTAFKQWSNAKSIVVKYQMNIWPLNIVCPPYSEGKKKFLRTVINLA